MKSALQTGHPHTRIKERNVQQTRLSNPWLELWFKQVCNNQLAADTMTRNIDDLLAQVPRTLVDQCLPPSGERLNPLEFHGRSREPSV